MAKRGRPALQLSASERLERRRAQLARSQRKSRARRRSPHQCASPSETSSSSSEDPTTIMAAPTSGTRQELSVAAPDMNPQPPESHRDNFSWMEAVFDNSPASPALNILERSEAHCLSRVLEAAEHEHQTPLELDTTDPPVFLPNLDDSGYPSCSMRPGSDSVFPAVLDNGFCTPSTCSSAEEATLLPWLVPEGNSPDSLLYPETVLDPSFTTIQSENHRLSPEQKHQTTQEPHTGNLLSENWASSPLIPSPDSFAIDAPLLDGQEWNTILQPTALPSIVPRGFHDCRTVRVILTFAV
ncbi:hypothetical protein CEP54_004062 [Fusarium duplospermum]|uniref:Uncharacterized protein n=1 Tax=Fusarium duplospermum TaxID=1325734 RepID=A0A428QKU4_9HYPO|nr:hypothetical protein CEP54_004062 [Fusarium duplospermum]